MPRQGKGVCANAAYFGDPFTASFHTYPPSVTPTTHHSSAVLGSERRWGSSTMTRHTLGTFICGLAGYLDDLGRWVKGPVPEHVMYQSNGQVDKVK